MQSPKMRGPAGETQISKRLARQAARLTDAGLTVPDLEPAKVLALLRLRGPDRQGVTKSSYYRWAARFRQDDDGGRARLARAMAEHEPAAFLRDGITLIGGRAGGRFDAIERAAGLLAGMGAADLDVLTEELDFLAGGLEAGGSVEHARYTRGVKDLLETLSEGAGDADLTATATADLVTGIRFGCAHTSGAYDRFQAITSAEVSAGAPCTGFRGLIRQTRLVTACLDAVARCPTARSGPAQFRKPVVLAAHLAQRHPPTVAQTAVAESVAGAAALWERAILDVELHRAQNLRPLPQHLTTRIAQGMHLLAESVPYEVKVWESHADAWTEPQWRSLKVSGSAAALIVGLDADPELVWGAPSSDKEELERRARDLVAMGPVMLRALGTDSRWREEVGACLADGRAERCSWSLPAHRRAAWLRVALAMARQTPYSPQAERRARTTERNLVELRRLLTAGHVLSTASKEDLRRVLLTVYQDLA